MGDSLCDMLLKEHEKYFPFHAMMQAFAAKPKTPYQLDLEVKDRKPSIVPKVGDRVKIKSREWYEKWKDESNYVNVPEHFVPPMAEFCGKVLTVEEFRVGRFKMKEDERKWSFSLEMFEEVYPVQEQLSSKFPRIDLSCHLPLESHLQVNKGELIVPQVDFGSMIEKTAKRLAAYSLVQGLTAKPKLKQVKTTHLLRLKKL